MRKHFARVELFVSVMLASALLGLFSSWVGRKLTPAAAIERAMLSSPH